MTNSLRLLFLLPLITATLCAPFDHISNTFTSPDGPETETNIPLFEGDIAGIGQPEKTVNELREEWVDFSKGGVPLNQRWPDGQVYYLISPDFSVGQLLPIFEAMNEISTQTTNAVRFLQQTTQADYINIVNGSICYSYVGKAGGRQELSLADDCRTKGLIMHKLMHAIGFFHENSRTDRDTYVDINWSNIQPGMQMHFQTYASDTFNTPYDFASIMHFPSNMYAVDPAVWTIQPKTQFTGSQIGQRNILSPIDIEEIRAMYNGNAAETDATSTATTAATSTATSTATRTATTAATSTAIINITFGKCAILYHEFNFNGTAVTLVNGQSGNLAAADQGRVKSAIITAGCRLTTYSWTGFQGAVTEYPTFGTSDGFFNFLTSCSSVRCNCV